MAEASKLKHEKAILFLVLLVSFTTVYSSFVYFLLSLSHPPSQAFIGFGVYDNTGDLSNYFQNSSAPNVTIGGMMNWRLEVGNRMGNSQMVQVVIKLGNLTSIPPSRSNPARVPDVDEYITTVANTENNTIIFNWRL
ncbi:MAG TPA: hypothetical protein VE177_05025, partial [Candidatus Binatus sp.]|nr:hypothetical protein [Candidatus Binatus sp.]